MNESDIKQLIMDTMNTGKHEVRKVKEKTKMQFSKKLMVFSCVLYACTWVVCVVAWFWQGVFPEEIKTMATVLFGASFACYEAKACIENKTKLECGTQNYQDFP
jgi:hypothetical protein